MIVKSTIINVYSTGHKSYKLCSQKMSHWGNHRQEFEADTGPQVVFCWHNIEN
jgi:hypothetical protein